MLRSHSKPKTAQKASATTKKVAKQKKVVKLSKRAMNCHSQPHEHVDVRKAGVRIGQIALSQKFPEVTGTQVLPGTLETKPFSTDADLSTGTAVVFTYPLDFTFTCPTELIDMSNNMARFKALNTKVFGLSTDSVFSHQVWMRQPRKQGGIEGLEFPLVSDTSGDISATLGALMPTGFTCRATYILHDGVLRHFSVNEPSVGRNSEEVIRMVEAIQYTTTHGEVCAAGFTAANKKAMKPTREGLLDFAEKNLV